MNGIMDEIDNYSGFSRFKTLEKNKALVVTALALERMWMPCMEGVRKTDFTEKERSQYIKLMEKGMKMVWGRVKRGYTLPSDYIRFNELNNLRNDLIDPDYNTSGAELEDLAEYLWHGVIQSFDSFFVDEVFNAGWCYDVVDEAFDMVNNELELFLYMNLYEESINIKQKNKDLSSYIMDHHPVCVAESKCVDRDMDLAQNYPHNMDEIMKRREEYHNRNIIDFKPLEEYGFHVEPVR